MTTEIKLEQKLWQAADTLRGNIAPSVEKDDEAFEKKMKKTHHKTQSAIR